MPDIRDPRFIQSARSTIRSMREAPPFPFLPRWLQGCWGHATILRSRSSHMPGESRRSARSIAGGWGEDLRTLPIVSQSHFALLTTGTVSLQVLSKS